MPVVLRRMPREEEEEGEEGEGNEPEVGDVAHQRRAAELERQPAQRGVSSDASGAVEGDAKREEGEVESQRVQHGRDRKRVLCGLEQRLPVLLSAEHLRCDAVGAPPRVCRAHGNEETEADGSEGGREREFAPCCVRSCADSLEEVPEGCAEEGDAEDREDGVGDHPDAGAAREDEEGGEDGGGRREEGRRCWRRRRPGPLEDGLVALVAT
mmetsp:Transcript_25183/g.50493  ORF Transcript_25183/g.50493 Transcript_25183/m.50493 type:complete len:211 (+) Transcript_25183:226-858(+)